MKPTFAVIAACVFAAAGAAVAADEHDHSDSAKKPPATAHGMPQHMKLMREQMAQIRAAQDPKERERLMNEHMKTMEESMAKMGGMRGCGKM